MYASRGVHDDEGGMLYVSGICKLWVGKGEAAGARGWGRRRANVLLYILRAHEGRCSTVYMSSY